MKSKLVAILSAFAILALAAVPASAEVGIFAGTAKVGDTCYAGDGAGLGLLTDADRKWSIQSSGVRTASNPLSSESLTLCGDLSVGAAGLGASCVTTQGSNGTGSSTANGGVALNNVGWDLTAGGTFVVSGDAGTGTGNLTALVQVFDDQIVAKCIQDDANDFLVQAVFSY